MIKIGEVMRRTGYSVAQIRRWAREGKIPGTVTPKNSRGHYRFRNIPAFNGWAKKMLNQRARKTERGRTGEVLRQFKKARYKPEFNDRGARSILERTYQLTRDYNAEWHKLSPALRVKVATLVAPLLKSMYADGVRAHQATNSKE